MRAPNLRAGSGRWAPLALGLVLMGVLAGLRLSPLPPAASGSAAPLPAAIDSSQAGLPRRLSETGLYAAGGGIDPRNRPFSPQYPLWTDGAAKARWIHLPDAMRIDVSDVDAWRFPIGTKLWKEFAWSGRKVETRFFWLTPTGWRYASYVWNAEQTEALLAPAAGLPRAFALAGGKQHAVPSRADCLSCHASAPSPVLGFTALQLSDDRDPLAPHAEALPAGALTLGALVAEGRLEPPRPELAAKPPRIQATDPQARAALGYLSTNCGVCHNSAGPLARLGFDLLHKVAGEGWAPEPALQTGLDAATRYAVPGVPADSTRFIAAGEPERSALFYRMASRRPASQMPPLGTVVADSAAVALVGRWIEGLASPPAAAQWSGR
jgi:hypothetical protein